MQTAFPHLRDTNDERTRGHQPTTAELQRQLAEARKSLDMMVRENYVRPSVFGREWGVSASTVRRWVAAGHLPAQYTPTGRMLIPRVEAEARIREDATITWKRDHKEGASRKRAPHSDPVSRAS